MTVALISLASPQAVIAVYNPPPTMISLPGGTQVYGAAVGWVSADGNYSMVNVTPFVLPGGQQITGLATYSVLNGVVTQTYQTQAIPNSTLAAQMYNTALQNGITLTWSVSTTLNGVYALDTNTQVALVGAYLASQNFTKAPIAWYMKNGTAVSFTTQQADLFGAAVWSLLTALLAAQAAEAAGNNPTWPSSSVSITG